MIVPWVMMTPPPGPAGVRCADNKLAVLAQYDATPKEREGLDPAPQGPVLVACDRVAPRPQRRRARRAEDGFTQGVSPPGRGRVGEVAPPPRAHRSGAGPHEARCGLGRSFRALGVVGRERGLQQAVDEVTVAAWGELIRLVGTTGACALAGRPKATHYRSMTEPVHGPTRPRRHAAECVDPRGERAGPAPVARPGLPGPRRRPGVGDAAGRGRLPVQSVHGAPPVPVSQSCTQTRPAPGCAPPGTGCTRSPPACSPWSACPRRGIEAISDIEVSPPSQRRVGQGRGTRHGTSQPGCAGTPTRCCSSTDTQVPLTNSTAGRALQGGEAPLQDQWLLPQRQRRRGAR